MATAIELHDAGADTALAAVGGGSGHVEFSFIGCTSTVAVKLDGVWMEKVLVDSVSGNVQSGRVLAIMGPSGAGKTTLLNMLCMEPGPNKSETTGSITLNGRPLSAPMFAEHCSYVPQFDQQWEHLTCR